MDQKQNDNLIDDITDALDGENKLNLTADQKDEEDDEAINQECENFLNMLKGDGGQNIQTDEMMKQLEGMMGNLLGGGAGQNNQNQQQAFQNAFQQMQNAPQFDEMADKMLLQFMDKEILEQPMQETHQAYIKYIEENKNKLTQEEIEKYEKQKGCVEKILEQLTKDPNDKQKLIELFEDMQAQGDPPQEVFGGNENPLNFLNQAQLDGAQGEQCTIF